MGPGPTVTISVSGQRRPPYPGKDLRVMTTDSELSAGGLDSELRADIRRLGVLLGQTLARQEGQSLLDLVEEVRGLVRADAVAAADRLAKVDLDTATQLA